MKRHDWYDVDNFFGLLLGAGFKEFNCCAQCRTIHAVVFVFLWLMVVLEAIVLAAAIMCPK